MKTLIVLALCVSSFSAFGQKFFVHADTTQIKKAPVIAIQKEIELQRKYLASLQVSPKGQERAMREKCNFTTWQPGTREVDMGNFLYYTKDSLSSVEKLSALEEICARENRILIAHYNILYIRNDKEYYHQGKRSVLYSSLFPRAGLYVKLDSTFEVNGITRQVSLNLRNCFDPKPGEVTLKFFSDRTYLVGRFTTAPIHEFSHVSTDGNKFLLYQTSLFLDKLSKSYPLQLCEGGWFNTYTGQNYCEFDDPSEIKARLDALRYVLYQKGYYDARTEDFTEEHLKLLLNDSVLFENSDVYDLCFNVLKNLNDLIWMMNNIQ